MDRASKGMMDFFDKHEGRAEGSSFKGINKERVRQGYKVHKDPNKSKALADSKDSEKYIIKNGKKGDYEGAGKGTGTPKAKWGAKQGNWHKVMPGDK